MFWKRSAEKATESVPAPQPNPTPEPVPGPEKAVKLVWSTNLAKANLTQFTARYSDLLLEAFLARQQAINTEEWRQANILYEATSEVLQHQEKLVLEDS